MKKTEWTFEIPEVLKLATRNGRAEFSVNYFNSDTITKTLTVMRSSDDMTKCFFTDNISTEKLGDEVAKFIDGRG